MNMAWKIYEKRLTAQMLEEVTKSSIQWEDPQLEKKVFRACQRITAIDHVFKLESIDIVHEEGGVALFITVSEKPQKLVLH